jgi:hypothetical protein
MAKSFGLSAVYHAVVVLNLSWLNNVTACALFFWWFLDNARIRNTTLLEQILSKEFIADNLHLSATAALRIGCFPISLALTLPCNAAIPLHFLYLGTMYAS